MLWMDLGVKGGAIAVNQSGQIEGRLELDGGFVLTFVMGPGHTCNLGWSPAQPAFMPTREEREDDLAEEEDHRADEDFF